MARLRMAMEAGAPRTVDIVVATATGASRTYHVTFLRDESSELGLANVTALPDDGGAWLVFDPPSGAVDRYEVQLDGGPWCTLLVNASPVYVAGLSNGQTTELRLRAVRETAYGTPAGPVTVTPTHRADPNVHLSIAPVDGRTYAAVPGERVSVHMVLVIENLDASPLEQLWLHPRFDPTIRATLGAPPSGSIYATPGGWYWHGANLAPNQKVEIPLTLEWEVQP